MDVDYKLLGKRIKIARINAELNQEELAELVKISPTHMSNIETGTTRVSLQAVVRLANALSVSSDDLLCDSVIKSSVQFKNHINMLLEDCNEYEIRVISDIVSTLKDTLRRDAMLKGEHES